MRTILLITIGVLASPFVVYVLFKFATFGFFRGRELAKRFPKTTDSTSPKKGNKPNE